jgi:hypothetical protein
MHVRVLDDAVAHANLVADLLAERLLFGVSHLQLTDVVRLLGNPDALGDPARELPALCGRAEVRPCGCHDRQCNHATHHVV